MHTLNENYALGKKSLNKMSSLFIICQCKIKHATWRWSQVMEKKLKVSSHDTSAKTTDVVCHTNEENGLI